MVSEKQFRKFIDGVTALEPAEFIGVAKILGVELMEDEETPRDFSDILSDMMDRFEVAHRKARRQLLKVIEDSNKIPREV